MDQELSAVMPTCRYREMRNQPVFQMKAVQFASLLKGEPVRIEYYNLTSAEVPYWTHPVVDDQCMHLDCSWDTRTCPLV